ncbi:MAG: ABC transporter permease [Succiniclasticum sp.]|jgi:putative ABC transport system permease protein
MLRNIALKQLRHRPVTTFVMLLIMALSLGISVFLASLHQGLHQGLTAATEPFSLLVSAPGSQHQLVLNTVFLQDRPLPNLPYTEVEALNRQKRLVQFTVPLAFGDSYQGYRIVGAAPQIFSMKSGGKNAPHWLQLAQGRPFRQPYEVVVGADVARTRHLTLGSTFHSIHGLVPKGGHAHAQHAYTVVGILADVHGPYNQAMLTPLESIWDAHGLTGRGTKEVSAILVEPVGYSQAYQLAAQYQRRKDAMLVFPAQSIVQLFNLMGRGEKMWQPVGIFLLLLSILIVVLTSYLSSLSRLREYAVMRALGATAKDISHIFLWQNTFLVLGGTLGGTVLGLAAYALLARVVNASSALSMPLTVSPLLGALLVGMIVVTLLLSLLPMRVLRKKVAESIV